MDFQNKYYRVDEHGPLHYRPYPGGLKFPVYETITVKPGFKIWVDGGVLDYEQEVCYAKMLDCSATCCLQSYCGPSMEDCIVYSRRPYSELYIGILVLTTIVAGIPTIIKLIEFLILYKWCRYYDEDADAYLGGMTVCEAISYMWTCGKSFEIQ